MNIQLAKAELLQYLNFFFPGQKTKFRSFSLFISKPILTEKKKQPNLN